MNKYLLMYAAAAMATTASGGAARASTTVYFTGNHYFCDRFVITKNGGGLYAAVHYGGTTCGITNAQYDAGVLAKKTKGPVTGSAVQFADTTFAKAGVAFDGLDWVLGTPFGSAAWAIIGNTNGNTAFVLNSGMQSNKVKPGAKKSVLHDAIEALRPKN